MGDEASWDSRRGSRGRASSNRSASSSQRAAAPDGRDFIGSIRRRQQQARGLSRKWGSINRYILQARQWAEQEPTLLALQAALLRFVDKLVPVMARIRSRAGKVVERWWPGVERWGIFAGRFFLILLVATLDCSLRGIKSVLRLSSAALCLIFWCSILNLAVLAGFLSIAIATVVTIVTSFFLGLTPGFIVLSLYGASVSWMYGSFWTTFAVVLIAGTLYLFQQPAAWIILLLYAVYSCKVHGGWLGVFLCCGLSFVSSDVIVYLVATVEQRRQSEKVHDRFSKGKAAPKSSSQTQRFSSAAEDENSPSVSGAPDVDQTVAEEEVARILGSGDHYAVLGFQRFEVCEESALKREYRKKAMLVHPDKNKGNAKAEESFKRLQNAYEVLLDTAKKKSYDDDLRREELIMNFRRNGFGFHKNGRCESPDCGCHNLDHQDEGAEAELVDARPIVCKNCKQLHMWTPTDRNKQHARWCQECQEFHPAKDGDGWVEQFGHAVFFGLFQKVDVPQAYACAGDMVFNVTDWAICQGMKCPANTHKPSFFVSTQAAMGGGGGSSSKKGRKGNVAEGFPFPDMAETMNEQEFYDWFEKAMASGMFGGASSSHGEQQSHHQQQQASSSSSKQGHRKKKKGGNKKQW
ncbi:uncharacterized protein LOC112342982 [Selaginella moellendorffii]|uniref:uncharacterized protein LOC112342982 n=1 Tax=Selaginella moellendorffii TaxID=88036 RepID=UPI000D1C566D|nr:uncharacterized protein LOC112342982 [Selaginella moellendorffii]|eukprot:XP_024521479.1 uncharacterized protein LOC112342982 [Selaginella moellendorffii]